MKTLRSLSLIAVLMAVPAVAQAPQARADGTLIQIMRGILYPNSNVVFDAQSQDPEAPPDPSAFSAGPHRPFDGEYGGWEAVENASIALAETSTLLMVPGRQCSNGRPVPVGQDDWAEWSGGLRDAGMAAYTAAQSRSLDAMLDAADVLTVACANCHEKYRDAADLADRCIP